jgi:hypothetical protein
MAHHQKMADGRFQAAATSEFAEKTVTNTPTVTMPRALSRVAQVDFTFLRFNA